MSKQEAEELKLKLEERKVKALEKIAFNTEAIADAIDDFQNGEWPERLEYYLYLAKENYLTDPNRT